MLTDTGIAVFGVFVFSIGVAVMVMTDPSVTLMLGGPLIAVGLLMILMGVVFGCCLKHLKERCGEKLQEKIRGKKLEASICCKVQECIALLLYVLIFAGIGGLAVGCLAFEAAG